MPVMFGKIESPFREPPGKRVHLYVSRGAELVESLWCHLTESEQIRANRFRVARIRDQFIQARGSLRVLLAHYLRCEPLAVPIFLADGGKPCLPPETGLHFNLSHTDGLAAFAVAETPVGIDVEQVRIVPDAIGLVQRFFSPREHSQFCELDPTEIPAAFLRAWTRKEAVLKAMGRGVQSLDCCEVTFRTDEPPAVVSLDGDSTVGDQWKLHTWDPQPGFLAALAMRV
ncbi:4'-phosphopantetheinyl transferase family protein [Zavarzinella formosa]|uniref:4'-phosphopantetheinyl transferase family protein n=1 Tax=Zavarzinella formosa TaxID=360055 RepID=UPI0002D34779|nr:4'-phosphopantetheinyl transferase superfamily protein [Zavarzinella formosa]